jgi:hypothetical protein
MAISFHIDTVNKRIYSKAEGLITFEDLFNHIGAEVGPEVARYSEIFDCSGATTNLTVEHVRRLAEERRKIGESQPGGPTAVVATNDLFFGMLRMFDMLTETVRPLRVFRDMKAAEAWLDAIEANAGLGSERTKGEAPQVPKIPK